jgi:hypothetical protein
MTGVTIPEAEAKAMAAWLRDRQAGVHRDALSTWADLLDPPVSLRQKVEKAAAQSVELDDEDVRLICDDVLAAIVKDIEALPVVPNCGGSKNADGCYVKDERAAILARLKGVGA